MEALALPDALQSYAGRINDIDAHENYPAQMWVEVFGPVVKPLVEAWTRRGESIKTNANHPSIPDYEGDVFPIDANIGTVKGAKAPGAGDLDRRLAVMDAMGVRKQLMFPGYTGLNGLQLVLFKDDTDFLPSIAEDRVGWGKRFIQAHNEWAVDINRRSDRVHVAALVHADTAEELIGTTRKLINNGIKVIMLAAPVPPAGLSPAHPALDPFWAMLAEADCAVTLHIGTEGNLLFASSAWNNAPAFQGHRLLSEFKTDPWSLSVIHWPSQNFLATMITGGVFVRHPKLRFGVVESGSGWVGALAETLDMWHHHFGLQNTSNYKLPEWPSEYIRRNVRVSAIPSEDVAALMERHNFYDVICFATDYPHVEGGKNVLNTMANNLQRLGPEVMEKFFHKNGAWLLP